MKVFWNDFNQPDRGYGFQPIAYSNKGDIFTINRSIYWQKGENVMLDFTLSDGKRMTLEDCGDCLNAKLWAEDGEYMSEITWDIDSIADILFTEQPINPRFHWRKEVRK